MKSLKVRIQLNVLQRSESVLSYLNHQPEYRIVATTHDIELSELLKDNYQNFHFNETIENDEIHFDYKIKKVKRIREMQLNWCCELLTSLTKSTNEPRIRLKI